MCKVSRRSIVLLVLSLSVLLSACGSHDKFSAPEITPPSDLIPSYVPEGFKLVSGFQIDYPDSQVWLSESVDDNRISAFPADALIAPFFLLKSPAKNDILGVQYEKGDQLLLITKSYFPEGNLALWRDTYETPDPKNCDCECPCNLIAVDIGIPLPLRMSTVMEERTINETPVAILDGLMGPITVFIRDNYLITIEGGISLDENLKIVKSLLD